MRTFLIVLAWVTPVTATAVIAGPAAAASSTSPYGTGSSSIRAGRGVTAEAVSRRSIARRDVVRYDQRTVRLGPCYGTLDVKNWARRTYVMARFYSYGSTCFGKLAAKNGRSFHAIQKSMVSRGQWSHTNWYLDAEHDLTVCVMTDGMQGRCAKTY